MSAAATDSKGLYFLRCCAKGRDPSVASGSRIESEGEKLNFEVNEQTYFLDLAEDSRQWFVFVETPTGTRQIPVYVDADTAEDAPVLVEDRYKRKIVN